LAACAHASPTRPPRTRGPPALVRRVRLISPRRRLDLRRYPRRPCRRSWGRAPMRRRRSVQRELLARLVAAARSKGVGVGAGVGSQCLRQKWRTTVRSKAECKAALPCRAQRRYVRSRRPSARGTARGRSLLTAGWTQMCAWLPSIRRSSPQVVLRLRVGVRHTRVLRHWTDRQSCGRLRWLAAAARHRPPVGAKARARARGEEREARLLLRQVRVTRPSFELRWPSERLMSRHRRSDERK
jgi:hypothetical protein